MRILPDITSTIPAIEALVKETVAEILDQSDYFILAKGRQDLVTELDFAMEREIKRKLQALFPA